MDQGRITFQTREQKESVHKLALAVADGKLLAEEVNVFVDGHEAGNPSRDTM